MFYVIKNGNLLISNSYNALKDYGDILSLPDDYQKDKYIIVDNQLVLNPDWESIELNTVKENKIIENDTKRDEALNQGVIYKNVLFDSDTDQKVNLLAIVSTMDDEDEITWFGKDNQPLVCNKQDLINIGGLITQLHSFCWNKNALIKAEVNDAQTVEEVEIIEIDYTLPTQEEEIEPEIVEEGSENEGN